VKVFNGEKEQDSSTIAQYGQSRQKKINEKIEPQNTRRAGTQKHIKRTKEMKKQMQVEPRISRMTCAGFAHNPIEYLKRSLATDETPMEHGLEESGFIILRS
jgi:hypothetical protein